MDPRPETNEGGSRAQAEIQYKQFIDEFKNQLSEIMLRIENDPNITAEQKEQALKDEGAKLKTELQQKLTALENIRKSQPADKTKLTEEAKKQEDDAKKGVREALAKTIIAADKGLEITKDKKAQAIISELSKTKIDNIEQLGKIAEKLGPYITGDKEILFSQKGQERTEFEKTIDSFKTEDPSAYEKIANSIKNRHETFAMTDEQANEKFPTEDKELIREAKKRESDSIREGIFNRDLQEYYGRFSAEQQDFLHALYTPEGFRDYIKKKIDGDNAEKKQEIEKKKNSIKQEITEVYRKQGKQIPSEQKLDEFADERWRQQVSHEIEGEMGGVINQLLLRLQQEGANKFYDELAQEDFMHGITTTRSAITNALQTLQKNLEFLEDDPDFQIRLFKFVDQGHYIEEREKEGKTVAYPRLIPLLKPIPIGLKDFALQLTVDVSHLIEQRNYLHDSRVVFGHPPGKDGFYSGLAGYAEKYKGVDIDHIFLLPDGHLAQEAYYLYEKFLEEDFASTDWKHRPTQFTNELEYVNTQLENEIIKQMRLEYGKEYSEERIRAAVNIGVGLARGVFLTEPEKSAYADPVDNEGRGMVASYGTNDAGALNALNPLHIELRWQGEHHMFMYYFMPVTGEAGRTWDHRKMFDNMGKYFDSFIKGKGDLPDNLFINEMIGVTKAGGPFTRKGWRMDHSLEGYFKYKTVDLGNGKKLSIIDGLETFKAIDYLGYEPIDHFLTQEKMGKEVLSAKEGTVLAQERKKLFEHIYNCYFKEFDGPDFEGYMKNLRDLGKEKALEQINNNHCLSPKIGSFEEQIEYEISKIFLNRAVVREVALRFPSKFLRIDRGRFQKDGKSRWQQVQLELGMSRDEFNAAMKDFSFVEVLLRKDITQKIKDQLHLDPSLDLNKIKINYDSLNEETIERLLTKTEGFGDNKMTPERIERVKKIYRQIKKDFLDNKDFMNNEAFAAIKKYPYSFGVEDTALDLMAFRGTGPRMVARAIADTGILEQGAISTIGKLGRMLQQMAIDGKHDFSPIIEAMMKARQAFNDVHGTGDDYRFNYRLATAVIQYFKKDSMAKPLFGLFRIGRRNSIAAEYAGRSTAVWEWDSRDVDRFITAMESYRLIPKTYYDMFEVRKKGGEYENVFWKIGNKVIKTPFKKLKTDYEWNAKRLRKEFGGDWKAITFDMVNQFLPLALGFLLWQYLKKSMEEAEGKKK